MSKHYRPNSHWGTHLWAFIHTVCVVDYTTTVQATQDVNQVTNRHVYDCLINLQSVIPCPRCQTEYLAHLKRLPLLDLREPMVLFYWSVDLHNSVNNKLDKPLWSYERATKQWCH